MNADQVKTLTKYYIEHEIPFDIVMDNVFTYSVGRNGTMVLFMNDVNSGFCIRTNTDPDQAEFPIEMRSFDYDHVEAVKAKTDNIDTVIGSVKSCTSLSTEVENTIRRFLGQEYFAAVSVTGSTGDSVIWSGQVHAKPGLVSQYGTPVVKPAEKKDETDTK